MKPQSPETGQDLPDLVKQLLDKKKKGKLGKRGKVAERDVQKLLEHLNNEHAGFMFDRLLDTRAARAIVKAQSCDFLVTAAGVTFSLEVKETEHAFRLERRSLSQLPKLRKSAKAGRVPLVLVLHTLDKRWRCLPLQAFDGPVVPSWDLSAYPTFTSLTDALLSDPYWKEAMRKLLRQWRPA